MGISPWIYKGSPFDLSIDDIEKNGWYGFVYIISFPFLNRKYIGKKLFFSSRTLKPLKGKKRRRRIKKESNWRSYKSSSNDVQELIQKHKGKDVIYEILSLHPNKAETNYSELVHQIMLNVLESRGFDNERIYLNKNIERRFYPSEKFGNDRTILHENIKTLQKL